VSQNETHKRNPVSEPVSTTLHADARDDETEWPVQTSEIVDIILAKTNCADPARDIWPRQTAPVIAGWKFNGLGWCDVLAGVRAVMARPNAKPRSWAYFTEAIAQAHANRTNPIIIPEATSNERPHTGFKTTSERREDSTVAAFQRVFGRPADSEDEPRGAA
jgi:hypothetical protein